jgi:benzoyl-CoA 2,3-dioxygenase component B
MLNALNEVLRDDFIKDSDAGVAGGTRCVELGIGLCLPPGGPHKAFNRQIGALAGTARMSSRLMGRVVEPGKFANWIAPPVMGINRQPVDFEYVRFN